MLEDCFAISVAGEFEDLLVVSGYASVDMSKLNKRKKVSLIRALRMGVMPSKSGTVHTLFRCLCVDNNLAHIYMSTSRSYKLVTWKVPKEVEEDITAMVALRNEKDKTITRRVAPSPYKNGMVCEHTELGLGFVRNVMRKYDNRNPAVLEGVIDLVDAGGSLAVCFNDDGTTDKSRTFTILNGNKKWITKRARKK